jgi:cyanate lyase
MTREEVTAIIVAAKTKKNVTWKQLAEAVGQSSVWTTAALLGQMSMTADEAKTAGELLGLSPGAIAVLQTVPARGSLPQAVPTDPLIYRFYEIVQVYGTTLKSLIEEEFGDGIMSAIDFTLEIDRVPDPKGDRVKVTLNGKFLPYKRV